jgi:hypothetical protein
LRDPYPGKRKEKDEEIQSGVDDSEDYCRLEAKWAIFANACERPPVCSKIEATVEDETEEEASGDDNKDERGLLKTSPDKDAAVKEEEGKLSKAQGKRLHNEDDIH